MKRIVCSRSGFEQKLKDIDFIMHEYVHNNHMGMRIVPPRDGRYQDQYGVYDVQCDGYTVRVQFIIDSTANYVYTLDDEGPYEHDSYEYIANDIYDYVQSLYPEEEEIAEAEDINVSLDDVSDVSIRVNSDGDHNPVSSARYIRR